MEAVEVALVLVLVIAGVFAESVETLPVALIVGGEFGADLIGGPFGGAGVAVEVEAVAEFRSAVGEFGTGGVVVEPIEVTAGEGIARVGGEAEELEEGRAGGVVGGGSGRGSGLDRETGDFGAEVIGEGGGVFVLAHEATNADFVLEGLEGKEEVAGTFPLGAIFGLARLKDAGVTLEPGIAGGGLVGFPGLGPTL